MMNRKHFNVTIKTCICTQSYKYPYNNILYVDANCKICKGTGYVTEWTFVEDKDGNTGKKGKCTGCFDRNDG